MSYKTPYHLLSTIYNKKSLLILIVTSVLSCGFTWWSIYSQRQLTGAQIRPMYSSYIKSLVDLYGFEVAGNMKNCPQIPTSLSILAFFILPLTVLILGFDSYHQEKNKLSIDKGPLSSIKLVPSSAFSILVSVMTVLFVYHFFMWVTLFFSHASINISNAAKWGPKLWFLGVLYSLPYIAITVLSSTIARTKWGALLINIGILFFIWLMKIVFTISCPSMLIYLPNGVDKLLLSYKYATIIQAILTISLWSIATICLSLLLNKELLFQFMAIISRKNLRSKKC